MPLHEEIRVNLPDCADLHEPSVNPPRQVHHVTLESAKKPALRPLRFQESRQLRPLAVQHHHRRICAFIDESHLSGRGPKCEAALRVA